MYNEKRQIDGKQSQNTEKTKKGKQAIIKNWKNDKNKN